MSLAATRNDLSFAAARKDFEITKRRTYLNNASIAPMSGRVIVAVNDFLRDVQQNGRNNFPKWGVHADTVIKGEIAKLINSKASEIAFIKNTTEGLNFVANGLDWRPGDNVIIANIEYPSNVYCWQHLASQGVEVRWVDARAANGRVTVKDLKALMDARTRMVSLSSVQFSNGYRQDVVATGELCRKNGILLNYDVIQMAGSLKIDTTKFHVDFMSAGGHKWMTGPIGTGFFYCRTESLNSLKVRNVGFHTVQKSEDDINYDLTAIRPDAGRFEEALVNFPGLWGLHAAVCTHNELGPAEVESHVMRVTDLAIEKLKSRGYSIVSPLGAGERSGILCFRHPTTPSIEIKDRLMVAGVDLAVRDGNLRISPSFYNDETDIERLMQELPR